MFDETGCLAAPPLAWWYQKALNNMVAGSKYDVAVRHLLLNILRDLILQVKRKMMKSKGYDHTPLTLIQTGED